MNNAIKICEDVLRAEKAYNLERAILPSENAIIDRLLDRHLELFDAYVEIYDKLHSLPNGIKTLLGVVVRAAAFWNPDRVAVSRDARTRLEKVNREIGKLADCLTNLLAERTSIENSSGFSSNTHYHIIDVIDVASRANGYHHSQLRNELETLCDRYDLKYWPRLSDIAKVIAQDAKDAVTNATDARTKAATTGSRRSRADFFKAFFELIKENGEGIRP